MQYGTDNNMKQTQTEWNNNVAKIHTSIVIKIWQQANDLIGESNDLI